MPPEAQTIGRRYQLVNLIGQGGFGAVYRAADRLTGQTIALKRVIAAPDEADFTASFNVEDFRLSLAQEFKVLASLRHPHIIGVLDYGFESDGLGADSQPYFTMELLENAQDILAAGRALSIEKKVHLLIEMLRALSYLHRRGILHRDLKPANILVVHDHVKLLDFGLSLMHEHADAQQSMTAGTLAYMAPEVLTSQITNEASDLYAVGLIAYELFAGRHPFDVDNPGVLVNQILMTMPNVEDLDLDMPLTMTIDRLLQKRPEDRFEDANEAIVAFSEAIRQPVAAETAATRESFLQAARLVGRDAELHTLSNALEQAFGGKGSTWLIAGESGVGKSRFLDELRALAMVRGALVMRGQNVSKGGIPYQMWQQVVRWAALLVDLDEIEAGALKLIAPEAASLADQPVGDSLDPQAVQAKLLTLLERMLRAQTQPIVMILEDLHWAGSESIAVLSRLNRAVESLPLLIIASYRDDERPDLPSIVPEMRLLKLSRLTEASIAELSAAMLGETGRQPQIVGLLQRETEGNVFFLVEVVRALAEEAGRLDKIGHMTLPEHVFAGGIRKIIQRRLNRVPRESRVLLEFAAVIGRQLDLALLKQIAPDTDLDRWLTDCANAAVLDVDADMWRFAHDKLRDGMLNELTDAEQQVLHRRVAQAMEALYGASPQHTVALAYHWGEAGDAGKEEYYTTLAGQQALSSGAFREAAMFLQRALLLVSQPKAARPDQLDQKEIELKARLAEAYLGFGRYEDAQRLYNENLAVYRAAQHQQGTADMLCKLGDVALALAAPEAARDLYEQALEIYRAIGDQGSVARALNSLGNVAYELGEQTSAKALFQESLNLARELGDQWGMAGSLSKAGGGSGAAQQEARRAALLSTLDAQHSAGDQPGIADTLQALGALAHEIGDLGEAQQLYRRSLTIRRALNQPDDVLHLLDQLGRVATAARAYADARGYLREALSQAAGARQMAQVMRVLGNLAGLYAAEDRHEQALELIAFVISHPDTDEETQNRVEGLLVELEDQVAPKLIEGAWERGKSRQFDDLLRETLR